MASGKWNFTKGLLKINMQYTKLMMFLFIFSGAQLKNPTEERLRATPFDLLFGEDSSLNQGPALLFYLFDLDQVPIFYFMKIGFASLIFV